MGISKDRKLEHVHPFMHSSLFLSAYPIQGHRVLERIAIGQEVR